MIKIIVIFSELVNCFGHKLFVMGCSLKEIVEFLGRLDRIEEFATHWFLLLGLLQWIKILNISWQVL